MLEPRASLEPGPLVTGAETSKKPAQTRREFLSEYWGERWPDVERAILASDLDLNKPIEIVPWEVAAERLSDEVPLSEAEWRAAVETQVGWHNDTYDTTYDQWIRSTFGVGGGFDEVEIRGLEEVCRSYNEQLRSLGELYATQLDAHLMDRWSTGAFVKAPLSTHGVSKEMGFYSTSTAAEGWSYVITLKIEDCPDIAQTKEEVARLREERDRAGAAYLRGLRPR